MTMKNTKIFSQLTTSFRQLYQPASQTSNHPGELFVSLPPDNAGTYIVIMLIHWPTDHSDSQEASKPGSQSIKQPKTTIFFLYQANQRSAN